jgi:Protein of unknown function (DUF1698)
MLYRWKVRALKRPALNAMWRRWRAARGDWVGDYKHLADYIRQHAKGRSFADIGCMWGVNGAFAFIAEEAGATIVKAVDVFGPTPEFTSEHRARRSSVEFVLGDCTQPETLERIGEVDVVFCAGVLYHHPSPFDLLVALRRICRTLLILRTATIPEMRGLRNAAVYFPMLGARDRELWNLRRLGVLRQAGISDPFAPEEGYGNWFWGLTPSCLTSMVRTAGFRVDFQAIEAFAQTLVCTPVATPFAHRLPDPREARAVGEFISSAGSAKPG